jgi:peptidylamidoglycolate lyase
MLFRDSLTTLVTSAFLVALMTACGPTSDSQTGNGQAASMTQQKGGNDIFGPYRVVQDWPQPLPDDAHSHDGWTWGSTGAVFAESPDRIWIAQRGELPLPEGAEPWTPYSMLNPFRGNATGNSDGVSAMCEPTSQRRGWERRWEHVIFVVDGDGNLVDEWPQHDALFGQLPCGRGPHTIKMNPYDAENHVWVIDDQLHVIYRFTYDGELDHTLGQVGVLGRGPNTFARPTDIAWLPDGTYFISDGYDGKRVAKFDANDNFLMDWGSEPVDPANPGPSEFNTPHSIQISADRRVFVVDRGHQRMQVFDENGEFLDMWSFREDHWPDGIRTLVVDHLITEDQHVWVGDAGLGRISQYDLEGNFMFSWGGPGGQPGQFGCPHQLSSDQESNLYVADCFNGRVQKFTPLPNADQAELVGQIQRYSPM